MSVNKHSVAIPDEVITQMLAKLTEIDELLKPYVINVTDAERRELPRMGNKTEAFVRKSLDYAQKNSSLCPNLLDMDDFQIDLSDATKLAAVQKQAQHIAQTIDDIEMVAGSEALQHALTFYNYLKYLASQNMQLAKELYADLKERFPGRRHTVAKQA